MTGINIIVEMKIRDMDFILCAIVYFDMRVKEEEMVIRGAVITPLSRNL